MRTNRTWLDAGILYVLAALLVLPVFRLHYLNRWSSIESTFIADGRMFEENWTHHLWQPRWYAGTRTDYVYPPGLRYAVAILSGVVHITPAHAYHIAIGLFYIFGIVAVYLWTRTAVKDRASAWLAAAGVALLSPCFLLLPDFRADSLVPWRLHVLMSYGEGPHISSLAVLPIAWLGAWRRFQGGGVRWLLLSACAAAVVVSINFYGATALAITFPLLAWACYLQRGDWRIFRDSALIAALAYSLTAWWLVPSYIQITSRNLRLVAPAGNFWSIPVFAAILAAYIGFSLWIRRWRRFSAYSFFIGSGAGFLGLYVLGYRRFGFQVAGNSLRLVPEFDLFLILCGVELVRLGWQWRPRGTFRLAPRIAIVLLLLICCRPGWRYVKHVYSEFPQDDHWQQRVEYRTPAWLEQQFPDQRVFVSGTIRFWYNAWHNGQQADGGSDQGILNPLLPAAKWAIIHTDDPERLQAWLEALGVDIVVVPGPTSQESFKEFEHPQMYDAHFPLLRDDGEGNRFYRVPRRATGIVRIVDRRRLEAVPVLPQEPEKVQLCAYAQAVQIAPPGGPSPDRARGRWHNDDTLDVDVDIKEGESLLVQENYDPYWRAYVDGRGQAIQRDAVGFMMMPLPPGRHLVRLVFETPIEVTAGRVLAAVSLMLVGFLALRPAVRR